MKKGVRKVVLYLITFFTCVGVDVVAILVTKTSVIPFGENLISMMFMSAVAGLSAEHFAKKSDNGSGENGA